MPTGYCDMPKHSFPYAIVWNNPATGSTGSYFVRENEEDQVMSIFNSEIEILSENDKDWKLLASSQNQNKKFIKLHNSFDRQYAQLVEHYNAVGEARLREGLSAASSNLFDLSPDSLSLQLTYDQSLFFTFTKGNRSIYFELFFDAEVEGTDEAVITLFEGDINILNYAGSFAESIEFLHDYLLPSEVTEMPSIEYALS